MPSFVACRQEKLLAVLVQRDETNAVFVGQTFPIDPRRVAGDDIERRLEERSEGVLDDARPDAVDVLAVEVEEFFVESFDDGDVAFVALWIERQGCTEALAENVGGV